MKTHSPLTSCRGLPGLSRYCTKIASLLLLGLLPLPALQCIARDLPAQDSTWVFTGDLVHRRTNHGASLLFDGGVLVSGGAVNNGILEIGRASQPGTAKAHLYLVE